MTIVADTNIWIISLTSRSPYHEIFIALRNGKFDLAISNEILTEYHEVISNKYSPRVANEFIHLLTELPNVHYTTVYYYWDLIKADQDDNKFADCAIAAAADYLVTEDNHFNILHQIDFPKVTLLGIDDFSALIAV